MYEEQIQTITAQVAEALAEQSLPFAPDQRAALELLRAPGWAEELAQLLPIRRRGVSCLFPGGTIPPKSCLTMQSFCPQPCLKPGFMPPGFFPRAPQETSLFPLLYFQIMTGNIQ